MNRQPRYVFIEATNMLWEHSQIMGSYSEEAIITRDAGGLLTAYTVVSADVIAEQFPADILLYRVQLFQYPNSVVGLVTDYVTGRHVAKVNISVE